MEQPLLGSEPRAKREEIEDVTLSTRASNFGNLSMRRTISERLADLEAEERAHLHHSRDVKGLALALMVYRSVGVIFGDLGTSPMYIFPSIFDHPPSKDDAMGALSLIIWTLTLLALVKYVLIVLWANDNGEGGTISLYSLLCQQAKIGFEYRTHRSDRDLARLSVGPNHLHRKSMFLSPSLKFKALLEKSSALKRLLFIVVILGTSAVIADGILTPGVSVLSAVEGLRVAIPSLPQGIVVLITVFILLLIFSAQQFGTDKVGSAFAPVLILWLAGIAGTGVYNLCLHQPTVFEAISPHHAILFLARNKFQGWQMLGGVLLCVTGTEAMFADLGHFNIPSIQISFSLVAFPCLIFQYLGQTAYLISHPENYENAFWSSVPKLVFWPMFVIGTLAAIVASQALITGVFSISNQLMALNCLPPLKIKHTSPSHAGQIFVPAVNYFLMILTIAIVLLFQSSTNLSSAYGVAVSLDMITTTGLVSLVMILIWQMPISLALVFLLFFGAIEFAFFSSTLLKIPNGGWFPLVVAGLLTCLQYIWNWGQRLKSVSTGEQHIPADAFFAEGENKLRLLWSDLPITRVPGVGLFFSSANPGLPPVLQHFVRNVPAIHDVLVLVSVRHVPVTTILPTERILLAPIEGFTGLYRAIVRFGYNDVTDLGDGFAQEINASIFRICEAEESENEKETKQSSNPQIHLDLSKIARNNESVLDMVQSDTNKPFVKANLRATFPPHNLGRHSMSSALVRNTVLASLQSDTQEEKEERVDLIPSRSPRREDFLARFSMPVGSYLSGNMKETFLGDEGYRRHPWPQIDHINSEEITVQGSENNQTGFETPRMTPRKRSDESSSGDVEEDQEQNERIHHARMQGAVYVVGRSNVRSRKNASWLRRTLLNKVYGTVHNNFQEWASTQNIPQDRLMEVGLNVEI